MRARGALLCRLTPKSSWERFEEDHRIDARSPTAGVAVAHELAHEAEVQFFSRLGCYGKHQDVWGQPGPMGCRPTPPRSPAPGAGKANGQRAVMARLRCYLGGLVGLGGGPGACLGGGGG